MEEALLLIDATLRETTQRSLFSADQVMNLLLDVRQALVRPVVVPTDTEEITDEAEPVLV